LYAGDLNNERSPYEYSVADGTWTYDDSVAEPARVLEEANHDAWADWSYHRGRGQLLTLDGLLLATPISI